MLSSLPLQPTWSSQIRPLPWPYAADPGALVTPANPSILHTTAPSLLSHASSQIVPHTPLCFTSTRPLSLELPEFTNRMLLLASIRLCNRRTVVCSVVMSGVSPGSPLIPLVPGSPTVPFVPTRPDNPVLPFRPGSPVSPLRPCVPLSPFRPGDPVSPLSPFGPSIPAFYNTLFMFKSSA